MIHYQVQCSQGHEFDGWFKDSSAFDKQVGRGLIACTAWNLGTPRPAGAGAGTDWRGWRADA
jgi:hypothetical protein